MLDEKFFIALAFLGFILLVFRPVRSALLKMIDSHTEKALERLNNASKMCNEARQSLLEIQSKLESARREADSILKQAHTQAQHIIEDAKKDMENIALKKSDLLMQKIFQRQQQVVNAVKDQVVMDVIALVNKRLMEEMRDENQAQLTEIGIKSVRELIH
jgi:F-type H+-transporting ATPase subunit b